MRLRILVLLAFICANSFAEDIFEQLIDRRSGRTFSIIVLRDQSGKLLVANPSGPKVISKRDVQRSSTAKSLTRRLDDLFTSTETWIRRSRFPQAEEELPHIEKVLKAFEAEVELKLRSSVNSSDQIKSLKVARRYYQDLQSAVKPTIETLRLSRNLMKKLKTIGDRNLTVAEFLAILNERKSLAAIDNSIDLAKNECRNALLSTETKLKKGRAAFETIATKDAIDNWDVRNTLRMITLFEDASKIDPVYENAQIAIAKKLCVAGAAVSSGVLQSVNDDFSFKVVPIMSREGLDKAEKKVRNISGALAFVSRKTYGTQGPKATAALKAQITINDEALAAGKVLYKKLKNVSVLYRDGMALHQQGLYDQAIEKLKKTKAAAAEVKVLTPPFLNDLNAKIIGFKGEDLLRQLRMPADSSAKVVAALISESRTYVKKNRGDRRLKVSFDDMSRKVVELENFLEFRVELVKLRSSSTLPAYEKIGLSVELRGVLANRKKPIHAIGKKQLKEMWDTQKSALFDQATKSFLASSWTLNAARLEPVFLMVANALYENKKHVTVAKVLEKAYDQLDGRSEDFVEKLVRIDVNNAFTLSASDLDASAAIFARIKKNRPDLFERMDLDSRQLEVMLKQGEGFLKQDKQPNALGVYEKICQANPDFAVRRDVFKTLFEIRLRIDQKLIDDTPRRRALLEAYCVKYGFRMGEVKLLIDEKRKILDEVVFLWDKEKDFEKAVDVFLVVSKEFPALVDESKLRDEFFKQITSRVTDFRKRLGASRSDSTVGTTVISVPNPLLRALEKLQTVELKYVYEKNQLHIHYVNLKKIKAEDYVELGNIRRATVLLREIRSDYPKIAKNLKVGEVMEAYEAELLLERFRVPLGIRGKKEMFFKEVPAMFIDFGALLFWVVFWGVYLLNAFSTGRTRGQTGYNLKHFLAVFLTFLTLLVFFLWFGNLSHLVAVVGALFLPMILFNVIALFSYAFFPLIYVRRRVGIKKLALNIPVFGAKMTFLAANVKNQERDLHLLADPLAYRIEQAGRIQDRSIAAEELRKLLAKIDRDTRGKLTKNRPRTLLFLGIALAELGTVDEAESFLSEYVTLGDESSDAHWHLGKIMFESGRFEDAIDHFKRCLAERGGDKELMAQLGRCYFETGKFKSSLKCFSAVPDQGRDTRFFKARALARLGRLDDSVNCYQELLKENPDDARTLYSLASSFAVLNKDVKALKVIGLIKEGNPYYPHAVGLQGSIFLRNGKIDKARDHFKRALEKEPDLVSVLHGLGQLLLEDGSLDEAQKLFERVLEIEPFNAPAAFHLAVTMEKKDMPTAFELYEKAMEDPQLRSLASILAGRVKFHDGDYSFAIELFENGLAKMALSPRDRYMLAYSQLEEGKFQDAQDSLEHLNAFLTEPSAKEFAVRAIYDLGRRFLSAMRYKESVKAFALVKKNSEKTAAIFAHIDKLLAEASLRSVFELIHTGSLVKANKLLKMLAMLPESMGYKKTAAFHTAIINLRKKDYSSAHAQFLELQKAYPEDKRITYHRAICEIGLERLDSAQAIIESLTDGDLSDFLSAGTAETMAFILAAKGQLIEAEQVLANLKAFDNTELGLFMNQRIRLIRADLLCRVHDTTRLQFLMAGMDEDAKAQVAYLQAVSALDGGQISAVVKNLRPFADKTPENTKLFSILSAKLAKQMMDDGNTERAVETLKMITDPPACITTIVNHLSIAKHLESGDSPDAISASIQRLEEMLGTTSDQLLHAMIQHNLFIMKFKYPMALEDADQWDACQDAWNAFQAYKNSLVDDLTYWNLRLSRMCGDDRGVDFVSREVQHFMSDFNASVLLPTHVGRALACLQQDSPDPLNRHIMAIVKLGNDEDRLKEFVQRLGITAKHYSESLKKDDPLQKTWGFVIGYLMIQISVREALNPKEKSPLRKQLESYQSVRQHFASPSEFLQAKKVFNTTMLDALQNGIEGKFSKSGDALEKCLTNIPPGINLDSQLEGALWTLREQARKPGAADEQGVNVSQEFEKVYQRVLNYSIQRGA